MKISIIGGAGVVGSTTAFRIGQDGYAREIILVDVARRFAEAHALDIEQAVAQRSTTKVFAGELDDTKDSDIIIMAAGVPFRQAAKSRLELFADNLSLIADLAEALVTRSPSAVWIVATAPTDPLVYLIHKYFLVPRLKVIGLNRNDTSRFRYAIAKVLSAPSPEIEAFVLGEHGKSQVPIFSKIKFKGQDISLNPEQILEVKDNISDFFLKWHHLNPGRTPGWTSAESLGDIVSAIASGNGEIFPCSVTLKGEYGLQDVSLGVPIRFGPDRSLEVIEIPLNSEEKSAFVSSASSVKEVISKGNKILDSRR
jgi:malate dehydrogenase